MKSLSFDFATQILKGFAYKLGNEISKFFRFYFIFEVFTDLTNLINVTLQRLDIPRLLNRCTDSSVVEHLDGDL